MMPRRGFLLGGAILFASSLAATFCPTLALAAVDAGNQGQFMKLSNLLIQHQPSPAVGARIAEGATAQYKNLPQMLDAIISIAEKESDEDRKIYRPCGTARPCDRFHRHRPRKPPANSPRN